jgi:hypothetical protein
VAARFWTVTATLAGLACVALPTLAHAADEPFYEDTQYYEEDAWYDVTDSHERARLGSHRLASPNDCRKR